MTVFDALDVTFDSPYVTFDGFPAIPNFPAAVFEVAFAANVNDPISTMVWTDITRFVRKVDTKSGKQHERDVVQAGTATFVLDNRDGRFSPWNTASPYSPNMLPMRPIRVVATWAGVDYPVWFGYVESWPMRWADAVNNEVDVAAVDGFAGLATATLDTNNYYRDSVLADAPLAYLRLGEPPRSPDTAADASGNGRTGAIYGFVTRGASGALTSSTDTAMTFGPGAHLDTFGNGYYGWIDGGTVVTGTSSFTIEAWIRQPTVEGTNINYRPIGIYDPAFGTPQLWIGLNNTTGVVVVAIENPFGGPFITTTGRVDDDHWHHIALTRNGTAWTLYVDGVNVGTQTDNPTYPANAYIGIGGDRAGDLLWPGSIDEVAVYGSALSAARVAAHYQAAAGWVGQTSGQRIGTALDAAGWPTADRTVETGSSVLQPETSAPGAALSYLQNVEKAEDGLLFIAPDGKATFYGRTHPLINPTSTTSQVTLGGGAGEEPYRLDGTAVGIDNLDLWNEAVVARSGGAPQTAEDTASQAKYGRRTYTATGLMVGSDAEANDRANWIVSHYKDPQPRVGTVNIDPRSDPTNLFPKVLGLGLWARVTFKRATLDGGSVFQADQLIEGVEHHITPSTWRTVWNLSPAAVAQSYWIVGVSQVGIDTRVAY